MDKPQGGHNAHLSVHAGVVYNAEQGHAMAENQPFVLHTAIFFSQKLLLEGLNARKSSTALWQDINTYIIVIRVSFRYYHQHRCVS